MPIITKTSEGNLNSLKFNSYPDQFVSDEKKKTDGWIKDNLDYFSYIAMSQYTENKKNKKGNYDLVNGILKATDFYAEPETKTFIETLTKDVELPSDIRHYPIINPPINTIMGELGNRADTARVKAMDADSQNEELKAKTQIVWAYIIQMAQQNILAKHAQESGEELSEEELQSLTMEEVQDQLANYTSIAERWANKVLSSMKVEFNMKELSEEGMRDLLISSGEFFHIYENNSKTGMGIEVVNPLNFWKVNVDGRKYTSDVAGTGKGVPANGIISIMELSEIMETFKLTKKEIDHLRENNNEPNYLSVESSFSSNTTGIKSVKYPQGSRLLEMERMILEAQMSEEDNGDVSSALGLASSVTAFGNKFVVVQAYWASKQEIANVTYIDENGKPQSMLVDGTYEEIPNQIDIEWGYITRWMRGVKIGPHVYHCEPLRILDYNPIIGVTYNAKNTKARSLVDLMKPLQTIYNIAWNQVFRITEKEIGVYIDVPLRKIITSKEGDGQDAIEMYEQQMRERGIVYSDESIENTQVPTQNTSVPRAIDASLTNQINTRIQIAQMAKNECWELVGITRQRLGATAGATETATATQAGLSQSYTQTEPIFAQHQYLLNQVYQALVDAAQSIAVEKPMSTLSYVADTGTDAFIRINGNDLKMRDLKVFITSRAEDNRIFEKMQQLADGVLQSGGDLYDISVLYETNSFRQKQDILLKLKKQKEAMQQQQQQMEQQQMEQQQAQFEAQMQQAIQEKQFDVQNENYNKELDRINKKEVALINSFSKQEDNTKDTDVNGVPDILEVSRLNNDVAQADRDHVRSMMELQQKNEADRRKISLEQEKIQVARENMKNDLQIAKINAKNRNKPAPKKKK